MKKFKFPRFFQIDNVPGVVRRNTLTNKPYKYIEGEERKGGKVRDIFKSLRQITCENNT